MRVRFSSALTPLRLDIVNLKHKTFVLQTLFLCFSDPAMKQFLLHLDETLALGKKFIIQDLDETHLFVSSDIVEILRNRVDDLMDQISYTEKQQQ